LNIIIFITPLKKEGDLEKLIDFYIEENKLLSEETVLHFTQDILKGLCAIHALSIIHRDIKPSSLFLKNNAIVIGDFGISMSLKSLARSDHPHKNSCTISYDAPEKITNTQALNESETKIESDSTYYKSDIWSLACVIYELFTLHKAYYGKNIQIVHDEIVNGRIREIEGSAILRSVLNKMFKKKPELRPSSHDMLIILDKLISQKNRAEIEIINETIYNNKNLDDDYKDKALNNGQYIVLNTMGKLNMTYVVQDLIENKRYI